MNCTKDSFKTEASKWAKKSLGGQDEENRKKHEGKSSLAHVLLLFPVRVHASKPAMHILPPKSTHRVR